MISRVQIIQLWGIFILSMIALAEWGYSAYDRYRLQNQFAQLQPTLLPQESLPALQTRAGAAEQYSEFVERPLFVEGRKPVAATPTQNAGQLADGGLLDEWELVGIYSKDGERHNRAVLVKTGGDKKKQETLDINQSLAGWQITEIQHDRVVFQQNGQNKTVFLYKPRKFAGATPPRPAALPNNRRASAVPPPPVNPENVNESARENQ
jgi:hypothetical protein